MRKTTAIGVALVACIALYLLAWPVPIDPVSWQAPEDAGFTGAFSENDLLRAARGIDLGQHAGPEDVAVGPDGHLYATSEDGAILRISPRGGAVDVIAKTDGRPLGIEIAKDGSLLVANAHVGVQRVGLDGAVSNILTAVNDQPLVYADDLAVADDGTIYLTEASTKFGAKEYGGTLSGSLLDILEHGGNGLVVEYRPATDTARVLLKDLDFPNGIAISDDQTFLLIAETGNYRILKYWLSGPAADSVEVIVDNLPGFPDNINPGLNGRFWIGLVAPRNRFLDDYSARPFARKLAQRLPAFLRPRPVPSSHVFAIDGDGEVLMYLHDPAARFPMLTGAVETRDAIYFSSLTGDHVPWIDKRDLL